ncbi:hypothetical protein CONPUDRAFT_27499, partial [Coniophora puteana RWD-64-598 SS2]
PFKLCDLSGRILLWYLPDVVPEWLQALVFGSLLPVHRQLKAGISAANAATFRNHTSLFLPPQASGIQPGSINLSPGWYQSGHDKDPTHYPEPSANWRDLQGDLASTVVDLSGLHALASGVLRLVHPWQYIQGKACMRSLSDDINTRSHIRQWASVFNAATILSNRETVLHRDGGGTYPWYDILSTHGRYRYGQLSFPMLRIDLDYRPGTMVPFCGKLLRHGVPHCQGDRVCWAYYMKEGVHRR